MHARPDASLLDVACGPGFVAGAALARGMRVTAADFAVPMALLARASYPGIDAVSADAQRLPFADASFDALTIAFGVLHFAAPEQALAEAARVLRPGGMLAYTVWTPAAQGFALVMQAVQRHGRTDVGLPAGPPLFRYADRSESAHALAAAGLAEPAWRELPLVWRFDHFDHVYETLLGSTVRTSALIKAQSVAAQTAIRADLEQEFENFRAREGLELPMPALLVCACKVF